MDYVALFRDGSKITLTDFSVLLGLGLILRPIILNFVGIYP